MKFRPELLQVENRKAFWKNKEQPVLRPFELATLQMERRPILFIHGANYGSTAEVFSDLIDPFANVCDQSDVPGGIFLIFWHSNFQVRRSLLGAARALCEAAFGLAGLKHHAWDGAMQLFPKLCFLMERVAKPPIIISHSMGAGVMASTFRRMWRSGIKPRSDTVWWSLQPAIDSRSYQRGGEFAFLPRFLKHHGVRHIVWHSQNDMVLRGLKFAARDTKPMGLNPIVTSESADIEHLDLSAVCGEAHGTICFDSERGDFFKRSQTVIREKLIQLLNC